MTKKKKVKFKKGDVVVWTHENLNEKFWNELPEKDRKKYYGPLGYGSKRSKLFVFLSLIKSADGSDSGHCVLACLDDGSIEVMRHTSEFRKATDEEF